MSSACFHCGDTIPHHTNLTVTVKNEPQAVCCIGCQAVAESILAGGFEQYYRFRSETADKPADSTDNTFTQYDSSSVQNEFVTGEGDLLTADLAIEGMHCAACAWLIEKRLSQLACIGQIKVNAANHRAHIQWHNNKLALSDIFTAIASIGYQAFPFKINEQEARFKSTKKQFLRRIAVAALMSMQIMMLAFALYTGVVETAYENFFRWVSLILTLPIITYSAYPLIRSAIHALLNRSVNMDVPVVIAIVGIFIASLYATAKGTGEVYYESVSMFTLLLLTGRFLEHNVKEKAAAVSANMLKLLPIIANKKENESISNVAASSLNCGDTIVVNEGEIIPADGYLLSKTAFIDESMLTGESEPVAKKNSDKIYAGSVLHSQTIDINVSAVASATTLAMLANKQSEVQSASQFVSAADIVSKYFVVGVIVLGAATYLGWSLFTDENGFWPMISVLVATCPCALSLAMPTAMTAVTTGLKKHGILVNNTASLEKVAHLSMLAFDKTGTLTTGALSIKRIDLAANTLIKEQYLIDTLIALENYSSHPIASAFKKLTPISKMPVRNIKVIPGQGISGVINEQEYKIGNEQFLNCTVPKTYQKARLLVSQNGHFIAAIYLHDPLRDDAKQTLASLPCSAQIISGDHQSNVAFIAEQLNIDYCAKQSPQDKVQALKNLQQGNKLVGMVGDGINDAMVLDYADVSFAVANASDLSKQKSDVIFLSQQLKHIPFVFSAAKRLNKIIKQNLLWALIYNVLVLPLAILGLLPPYLAVAGMSFSSLLVVLNSTRLLK